jgi:hypothetical protein
MQAIEARISPIDRFDRDTIVHVSLLQTGNNKLTPEARAAAFTSEEDRISVRVTVNSNVELDENLEDDVIRVVQDRIVRDTGELTGDEAENARPDMVIQVTVNEEEDMADVEDVSERESKEVPDEDPAAGIEEVESEDNTERESKEVEDVVVVEESAQEQEQEVERESKEVAAVVVEPEQQEVEVEEIIQEEE